MKRDFSENTKKELLARVEKLDPEPRLGGVLNALLDVTMFFKRFFVGVIGSSGQTVQDILMSYMRDVNTKREQWISQINTTFELANAADSDYARYGIALHSEGDELLRKLKTLTSLATEERINGVTTLGKLDISFGTKEMITDDELTEYLQNPQNGSGEYSVAVNNVSSTVLNMDFWTAFMICLFEGKDIMLDDLLNTPSGEKIEKQIKQNILEGKEGYISIEELAHQLGISEERARALLLGNFAETYTAQRGFQRPVGTDLTLKNKLDELLREEMRRGLADETKANELLEQLGTSAEFTEATMDGDVNGYSVSCYEEAILDTLEDAADDNLALVNFGQFNNVVKWYKTAYTWGFKNNEAQAEMLKKIQSNGILSDQEIRTFLKTHCGYSVVREADIEVFRTLTKTMDALGGAQKVLGKITEAGGALQYVLEDYTAELSMLETMIQTGGGSPEYQQALLNVKKVYTAKFETFLSGVIEDLAEKGIEKALESVPGWKITDLVIDSVGLVTGADKHLGAAQDIITYASISTDAIECYNNALEIARECNYDAASLGNVRNAFSVMKHMLSNYYDAQIEYADGLSLGVKEDNLYKVYLNHEKAKIDAMELGKEYTPQSYEDFLKNYAS